MTIKKYLQFITEADAPPPAQPAPAQDPVAQPPAQSAAQPPAETPQPSGSTETPQSTGTTQGQAQGEKSGDLSAYSNEEITKFPDTVKKMVDLLKDMDKAGLVKVRNLIAEIKGIGDAKTEIGKL